ncbi:hypothetical protein PP175_27900 (plasmid) [Aneurinibacillus sp. Ricciae_BoGa-3]|uniref:hypothetical protein n=1 Tax=Aneurinibacillus sp. Ricciae_BoGa-3 TaxID=3022697 RepID=UPI0023401080|nr:hypothetical protein [Aneurinibacillus sp. Ricciae_BoGa-3]WCK57016.1 hypothetical protein PP175_27900 [Aneurinibacillus sp. Ricciae_BoGa-3]
MSLLGYVGKALTELDQVFLGQSRQNVVVISFKASNYGDDFEEVANLVGIMLDDTKCSWKMKKGKHRINVYVYA